MNDEIKKKRLAALLGMEYKPPEVVTPQETARRETVSREAEAVILFMEEPSKFTQKMCRVCHEPFMVNRANISCCGDKCRQILLADTYGLEVDLSQRLPQDRWSHNTGGREPLIIPPVVVNVLLAAINVKMREQEKQSV